MCPVCFSVQKHKTFAGQVLLMFFLNCVGTPVQLVVDASNQSHGSTSVHLGM